MTIDLSASFNDGTLRPGKSVFHEASAEFACANGKLEFRQLRLATPAAEIVGGGTADFRRNLDFKFAVQPQTSTDPDTQVPESRAASYRIAGTLAEPEFTRLKPTAARP